MAEFVFFTGPMDCGKSTLALQFDYTQSVTGRRGRLFTSQDRAGEATISSRLGLERPAVEVTPAFDFWTYLVTRLTAGERIDYLVCDETQFYRPAQIDQLGRIVDELQVDVFAVGILTDFRTLLFPGSRRLVELADRIETLQVRSLCWCGKRATHNARTVRGQMVTEGAQVVVGDTLPDTRQNGAQQNGAQQTSAQQTGAQQLTATDPAIAYEVLCRDHHRRGITRAVARTSATDPLPFERIEPEGEDELW